MQIDVGFFYDQNNKVRKNDISYRNGRQGFSKGAKDLIPRILN